MHFELIADVVDVRLEHAVGTEELVFVLDRIVPAVDYRERLAIYYGCDGVAVLLDACRVELADPYIEPFDYVPEHRADVVPVLYFSWVLHGYPICLISPQVVQR